MLSYVSETYLDIPVDKQTIYPWGAELPGITLTTSMDVDVTTKYQNGKKCQVSRICYEIK